MLSSSNLDICEWRHRVNSAEEYILSQAYFPVRLKCLFQVSSDSLNAKHTYVWMKEMEYSCMIKILISPFSSTQLHEVSSSIWLSTSNKKFKDGRKKSFESGNPKRRPLLCSCQHQKRLSTSEMLATFQKQERRLRAHLINSLTLVFLFLLPRFLK